MAGCAVPRSPLTRTVRGAAKQSCGAPAWLPLRGSPSAPGVTQGVRGQAGFSAALTPSLHSSSGTGGVR